MSCRRVIDIKKTVSFSAIILVAFGLAGCRTLPDVKLGPCEELDTKPFVEAFSFRTMGTIRYRYSFCRKNVKFTCNGIAQQQDNSIYIAGFSNAGITLFSAQWEDGKFSVLRNITKMPESFLAKSVLSDLLIVFRKPSDSDRCVRRNRLNDSLWLEMEKPLAGETGYFVINREELAWVGVQKGKVCYRAKMAINKELDCLDIEGYKGGYRSEIRILDAPDGRGSMQTEIQDIGDKK